LAKGGITRSYLLHAAVYSGQFGSNSQLHVLIGGFEIQISPLGQRPHQTQCIIWLHSCICQLAFKSVEKFKYKRHECNRHTNDSRWMWDGITYMYIV